MVYESLSVGASPPPSEASPRGKSLRRHSRRSEWHKQTREAKHVRRSQ
jgi:hypothetical protein